MHIPKVSICIPTYKQVEYLRKTLNSVLSQTFDDYEIVVADDSPDDSVRELVDTFDFGGRLKYYKNSRQLGSPANWNEAVHKSSGEYIKILHHDDWFTFSDSLEEYVCLLDANKSATFAFSAAVGYNIRNDYKWIHSATEKQLEELNADPRILFFGNFIGPPSSTIYKRSNNISYDGKLKWVVDFDFYIRTLLENSNFAFSSRELITSVSGANHNVTNECENSKEVELFEFLYLYKRINKNILHMDEEHLIFFKKLFKKYQVSIKDLFRSNVNSLLPLQLYLLALKSQSNDI